MNKIVTIKSNREFQRLYRRGRSAVAPTLVLYTQKNRSGASRLGITAASKLGCAVVRNRLRRQIREIYRLHREELVPGRDVIVVARARAIRMGYRAMERDFLRMAERLGLLRDRP